MSLGIYPVFSPKLRSGKFNALGETLAREFEALDAIADTHDLTRFTAFADNREVPADFDGPPEDLDDLLGPWDEWFEPAEGKAAFQALVYLIENRPTAGKMLEDPDVVAEELRDLIRVLGLAESEGARFRLEMS